MDMFPEGVNVIITTPGGVQIPCRLAHSLLDCHHCCLKVPSVLGLYTSESPIEVDAKPLFIGLYRTRNAKSIVFSVPLMARNLISPSIIKQKLACHYISMSQKLTFSFFSDQSRSGPDYHLTATKMSDSTGQEPDCDMPWLKVTPGLTQIFIEVSQTGVNEKIPRNMTYLAYGDVHSAIRGYLRCALGSGTAKQGTPTNAATSVLLVGHSGSAKSQIVEEEAEGVAVCCIKIVASSLLHLDADRAIQKLKSFFVSALLRQPCVVIVEALHQVLSKNSSETAPHIALTIGNFLQYLSSTHRPGPQPRTRIGDKSPPQVFVVGCTDTVDDLNISFVSSFEERISVPTNLSPVFHDCRNTFVSPQHTLMDIAFENHSSESKLSGSRLVNVNSGARQEFNGSYAGETPYVLSYDDNTLFQSLQDAIIIPRNFPKLFQQYNIFPPTGILLYGPSGTGKTHLVKTIVSQIPGSFINIRISDVMSGSIGESSAVVRNAFIQAKKECPSVLFIDEFQALFTSRGKDKRSNDSGSSLLFTLIGCLDDVSTWNSTAGCSYNVTVIAATNEPWAVDDILLRSGRFDKIIFVGPLSRLGRKELLLKLFKNVVDIPVEIDFDAVVKETDGYTGADVNILFQKSCALYTDHVTDVKEVASAMIVPQTLPPFNNCFFNQVLGEMRQSCGEDELLFYLNWGKDFRSKICR